MRPGCRLGAALACACTAGVARAFVPNAGAGWGAVRSQQGVEAGASIVIPSAPSANCFVGAPVFHSGPAAGLRRERSAARHARNRRGRSMGMISGGLDTFLGIGGPEVFVILAVGYFVLGPVELFKLTKEAGVLVGQLRDIGLGTVTNLGDIMNEQLAAAEDVASGAKPPPAVEEKEVPMSDEDEYEDVTLDEFGRIVYNEEVRPPPTAAGEGKPLFSKVDVSQFGFDSEEGPLKGVSKFAEQVSGAVNKNIMGKEEAANPAEEGDQAWEGQEGAEGAATGGPSGAGQEWQSPTDELGMENIWQPPTNGFSEGQELANDVPSELTIDEQFERLDTIAALEEERSITMQRLEAKIEAKIGNIKNELLELVDEDFQEKRNKVDREFAAKSQAKAAAAKAAKETASAAAVASTDAPAGAAVTSSEVGSERTKLPAGGIEGE